MNRRWKAKLAPFVQSRWSWLLAFGLLLAIAAAVVLYSAGTTIDPREPAFPNYMQDVGR